MEKVKNSEGVYLWLSWMDLMDGILYESLYGMVYCITWLYGDDLMGNLQAKTRVVYTVHL